MYNNLTGNLIIVNQNIPFKIDGNLIVRPNIKSLKLLDDVAIYDHNGIIFSDLITELSFYFNTWTIQVNIHSNSNGELWNKTTVVLLRDQNKNELYSIIADNNLSTINYLSNDLSIYNCLYKGLKPTITNNQGKQQYLTYQKYSDINNAIYIDKYTGSLSLSHTFDRSTYQSGDIIIKSPDGTLRDTFNIEIIVSTTESYTGNSYNEEGIEYKNNRLLTFNFKVQQTAIPEPTPEPPVSTIYRYNKDHLLTFNFTVQEEVIPEPIPTTYEYNQDHLLTFNFTVQEEVIPEPIEPVYDYDFPESTTNGDILFSYPDPETIDDMLKITMSNTEVYDESKGDYDFPTNTTEDSIIFSYPDPETIDDMLKITLSKTEVYNESKGDYNFPTNTTEDSIIFSYPDPETINDMLKITLDDDTEVYNNN